MERPGLARVDDDRCQWLRWKGMYISAEPVPGIQHSNDRAFWCDKTQICIGPDGKPADEYECNETRNCYSGM